MRKTVPRAGCASARCVLDWPHESGRPADRQNTRRGEPAAALGDRAPPGAVGAVAPGERSAPAAHCGLSRGALCGRAHPEAPDRGRPPPPGALGRVAPVVLAVAAPDLMLIPQLCFRTSPHRAPHSRASLAQQALVLEGTPTSGEWAESLSRSLWSWDGTCSITGGSPHLMAGFSPTSCYRPHLGPALFWRQN